MRLFRVVLSTALLLFLVAALAAQEVKPILDKAIQAAGGEANLKKFPALVLKGKGKFIQKGMEIPFTAEWYTQGIDQGRTITEYTIMNNKTTEIRVVNKDKGWVKDNQQAAVAMDKDDLTEEQESLYFNYITTLAPLKGKEYKLSALAEEKIDGKPAVGMLVANKQHRDVKLYFDKESGLLVKSERKVKDPDTGKENTEEVLFSNYKEVSGIKIATRFTVKTAGKTSAEAEMTDIKPTDKLDAKLFEKP